MPASSNALSTILSAGVIKLDLQSADKEEVFEEMIDLLVKAGKVTDRAGALEAIVTREQEQSTGIGAGVAVPHGKHESMGELCCALGISTEGVEFDSVDGEPAHVIFLALAQANNPGPHVALLAGISRVLGQPGFVRRLREARTPEEALSVIRATEDDIEE